MRKIALFIILAICLTAQFAYAAPVVYFNGQTHQWENQTIPNLRDILHISSAGPYAWAYSTENAISFYNGKSWSPQFFVPGLTKITKLLPGFPVSGKHPIAWACGFNEAGESVVAFFNGESWSVAQKSDVTDIKTSGGYVWGFTGVGKPIKMTNWQQPTNWTDIPNSEKLTNTATTFSTAAFNDNEPLYFMLSLDTMTDVTTLQKIDTQGQITTVWQNLNKQYYDFFVRNNDIIIFSFNDYSLSRNNGRSWKKIPFGISFAFSTSYADGMMCDVDPANPLTCVNNNVDTPSKQKLLLNNYDPKMGYQTATDATGVWASTTHNNIPYVAFYNFTTATWSDTQIGKIANKVVNIRAIGPSQLLACIMDKQNRLLAVYFNGTTWSSSISLPDSQDNCYFQGSSSANAADKSAWLYETAIEYQNKNHSTLSLSSQKQFKQRQTSHKKVGLS